MPEIKRHLEWKERKTWMPFVTMWLIEKDQNIEAKIFQRKRYPRYIDDIEWWHILGRMLACDIDDLAMDMADALHAWDVTTFHGCRTDNVGKYLQEGLKIHSAAEQKNNIHNLITQDNRLSGLQTVLDQRIADINNRDEGACFVVLDERSLLKYAAHYLIYGSEFVCAVLGESYRWVLQQHGTPTMLKVSLPLSVVSQGTRTELAKLLLREWTRQKARPSKEIIDVNFSFIIRQSLPPHMIIGHYHPAEMKDPLNQSQIYKSSKVTCRYCEEGSK